MRSPTTQNENRPASWNCSMKGIDFIFIRSHLSGHEDDANKVLPAICSIGCANTRRLCSASWKTFVWILITIKPSEICAWSRVQQKISGCFRAFTEAEAFARIRGYLSTLRKQGLPLLSALETTLLG